MCRDLTLFLKPHDRGLVPLGRSSQSPGLGSVFLFHDSPVLYKTARLKLQAYCDLAGIQRVTWHDLRHPSPASSQRPELLLWPYNAFWDMRISK
jgi:hypothetical protein